MKSLLAALVLTLASTSFAQSAHHPAPDFSSLHGGGFGDEFGPHYEYSCVSRDGDGFFPFVIAVRSNITLTRLPGTSFQNEAACNAALNTARHVRSSTLVCISVDGDGNFPFQLALLRDGISPVEHSVSRTLEACENMLHSAVVTRWGKVNFCSSHDGDGMNPFLAYSLDLRSGRVETGSENYTNLDSCQNFLVN